MTPAGGHMGPPLHTPGIRRVCHPACPGGRALRGRSFGDIACPASSLFARRKLFLDKTGLFGYNGPNQILRQAMMGRRRAPSRSESRRLVRAGTGTRADTEPGAVRLNRQ